MSVTVVSFYTPNDGWPEKAAMLRGDCERLGVDHMILKMSDHGSWLANCRQKPVIISVIRAGGPILWLDADTQLLAPPVGLDTGIDFMGRAKPKRDKRTWHVDAMYFGDTPAARALVDLWIAHLTDHSDEFAFDQAWKSGRWSGSFGVLPVQYHDGHPEAIVRYGRSVSERKTAEVAALRAGGR